MNTGAESELGLRIDAKNDRICIHRTTLKAIGSPEAITLGIKPKCGKLIVMAYVRGLGRAIQVDYNNGDSFWVFSKFLMESIQSWMPQIDECGSYLLKGKKMESVPAVVFDMMDIQTNDHAGGEEDDEKNTTN